MHRAIILATSLSCLAFSECGASKSGYEADTGNSVPEFWCSFYTSTIVYGNVQSLCKDELNSLDAAASDRFFDRALTDVMADCTDYVNGAADPDAIEYVVRHVCRNGYDEESEASTAAFDALTCGDVLTDDLVVTWPYESLCPCIATGNVSKVGGETEATCIE